MENKEKLIELCVKSLKDKSLNADNYHKRLKAELKEIITAEYCDYFIDLYDRKVKYKQNQHNLLVPYLLNLVENFDINKESAYTVDGMPDLDIDFIDEVRDYLKNDYAPRAFGREFVCNIGNYGTYGMRSALLDVAKIFGKDRNDLLLITKTLPSKDEEGHKITWEKALELDSALREFCENNPEIYDVAKRLSESDYGPRIKSMGKHAAGLIISSQKIDDVVPLVLDRSGSITSAWAEGLHTQDLAPMGYVKFDLLSITNLKQIGLICQLVKKRHGLNSICAFPDQKDWSDTSYLNDPKSLEMANRGDLKGIFQYDSPGIRMLARDGGVTSFDDLVSYASLYRPGPLGNFFHERYAKRKRGEEEYDTHPVLEPILGNTYGVLIYQEQVMKIFNKVGEIPDKDCYDVIKAISKKKIEVFQKYKDQFIEIGAEKLKRDCNLEMPIDAKAVIRKNYDKDKTLEENVCNISVYAFNENLEKPYAKAMGYVAALLRLNYPDKPLTREILHQEVAKAHAKHLFNQIEKFSGYCFNLAHATAYTYLTSRLLYLKSHYPVEFYAGLLMLEKESDKIKEYKTEALIHNVSIKGVDINKSSARFDIYEDDQIYFGLANIKGIGNEIAQKIVDGQPYNGFEHFLRTFGTEANVLKPLIALRAFNDAEPETLYLYYEDYKASHKYRVDRARRYGINLDKYDVELRELLAGYDTLTTWDETNLEIWENLFDNDEVIDSLCTKPGPNYNKTIPVKFNRWKSLKKLFNKRIRTLLDFETKEKEDEDNPFTLEKFNLDLCEVQISQELKEVFQSKEKAEIKYLGFVWDHPLEKSPDYTGRTFSQLRIESEECNVKCGPVELMIVGYKKREWKNGKGFSWVVQAEDANGEKASITVWPDDWTRFEEEFTTCKLLRLSLNPPSKYGYSLDSLPKYKRSMLPEKDKDYRVVKLSYIGESNIGET